MSNSSLVSYTKISPNKTSPRNHKIDRITPHCVVGQLSVEALGNVFASTSRDVSANYGIGSDGRVGMYVEEKDRSWCSSNRANDHRAITIECASDLSEPYAMKAVVYNKLVDLCTEICKRHKKTKLIWFGDKTKSLNYNPASNEMVLTVHRWFANKSCPGDWLYSRLGALANEVNNRLNPKPVTTPTKVTYKVQIGAFSNLVNAKNSANKAKSVGFDVKIVKVGKMYKAQVGSYDKEASAEALKKKLALYGIKGVITTESGTTIVVIKASTKVIKKGSRVKVKKGAKTYTGGKVASFVYNKTYTVDELSGNRAVLDKKGICTPFNIKDLILQ